jgi:cytidyltransferase-like protein
MDSLHRIPLGIAHGRFQPPHNGHVRYVLAALERAERVIVGICTPELCTEEEAARTGYPCVPEHNPFSYAERAGMLAAALDEAGVSPARYSFAALRSDYADVESAIPKNAVFLMSVTGAGDAAKIAHLASLGYATETIMELPSGTVREEGSGVRDGLRQGDGSWKDLVPESVRGYLEQHGLLDKLAASLYTSSI